MLKHEFSQGKALAPPVVATRRTEVMFWTQVITSMGVRSSAYIYKYLPGESRKLHFKMSAKVESDAISQHILEISIRKFYLTPIAVV